MRRTAGGQHSRAPGACVKMKDKKLGKFDGEFVGRRNTYAGTVRVNW
jgi:hypothetical protein